MLKAMVARSNKFGHDLKYEVFAGDSLLATLNETRLTFELGGAEYALLRKGGVFPSYDLKCGESVLAEITQKPLFNDYTLHSDGKEWRLKAIGLTAQKFGLYQEEKQLGLISNRTWRSKEMTVDLPDDLPQAVQLFMFLLLIRKWSTSSN
ncbi:MAG: hypothetical protein ABSE62_14710 [Chthoniobacteraceae bacterium]|jgi:hypothetical protein